jgi:hypothetical protein
MTFGFDTMLNYYLFQEFKIIGRGKFNHLTITLTFYEALEVFEVILSLPYPRVEYFNKCFRVILINYIRS